MTDMNLTEIVCVLDRSGSMACMIDDAIGGFNALLHDQQSIRDGHATMTIALFDNQYDVVVENRPVRDVKPLDRNTYVPRGSTALLDAVGSTIDRLGQRFASMPEEKRPGKVLFVILTDGQENSSRRYGQEQVADMIKHQTERYGWTFLYLSADINAFDDAKRLHIDTSVQFSATGRGVHDTYTVATTAARQYRAAGARGMSILNSSTTIDDDGIVRTNT